MSATRERCPSCGGDVHPIAGRCRHCHADLVALRAEAARAARAAARRTQADQAARAAAAFVVAPPEPAATTPRAATTAAAFAPPTPGRRRRALLLAALALVLGAGIAGGLTVGQRLHEGAASTVAASDEPSTTLASLASSALAAMPAAPDPSPVDPPAPAPSADPFSFTPSSPTAPHALGHAPSLDEWTPQVARSACETLARCTGADPMLGALCQEFTAPLATDDLRGRVSRGECRYDADAAGQCLAALGRLRCDASASAQFDPALLLALADTMSACDGAVTCED